MRLIRLVAGLGILLTVTSVASARQKPDFTGTWIIAAPAKGAGQEVVVRLEAKTLALKTGRRTTLHRLDGSESKQTIGMRGGDILRVSRAAWAGDTIVITTTTEYPNNMKTVEKETWSIDKEGRLVIDFTETAEGQSPRVVKVIHTRKS